MFPYNNQCNDERHKSHDTQVIGLLAQIQELKAVNNYQVMELEQKITQLEEDKKLLNTANYHFINDFEDFRKKIKNLEEENQSLITERNSYEQRYIKAESIASQCLLDEITRLKKKRSKKEESDTCHQAIDGTIICPADCEKDNDE